MAPRGWGLAGNKAGGRKVFRVPTASPAYNHPVAYDSGRS